MTKLDELAGAITAWAAERGILNNGHDISRQGLKVWEESGEIPVGLLHDDEDEIMDAIGDTFVTLVLLSAKNGMNLMNAPPFSNFDGGPSYKTPLRLWAEMGYIGSALAKNNDAALGWAICGAYTQLQAFAEFMEVDFVECVQMAYDTISQRTGKTVNGIFIKDSDLQE